MYLPPFDIPGEPVKPSKTDKAITFFVGLALLSVIVMFFAIFVLISYGIYRTIQYLF